MVVFSALIKVNVEGDAEPLYKALSPEENSPPSHRSRMNVVLAGGEEIHIAIISSDLASFRAALNSVFRLLGAVESVKSVIYERHI